MTRPRSAKQAPRFDQEAGGASGLLVGQDLAEGDPGAVIHGRVEVVVADVRGRAWSGAAMDPVAAAVGDAPEFLDLQVDQLARVLALVAHDDAADAVGTGQPALAMTAQHP
jgi:hypothetical protein